MLFSTCEERTCCCICKPDAGTHGTCTVPAGYGRPHAACALNLDRTKIEADGSFFNWVTMASALAPRYFLLLRGSGFFSCARKRALASSRSLSTAAAPAWRALARCRGVTWARQRFELGGSTTCRAACLGLRERLSARPALGRHVHTATCEPTFYELCTVDLHPII